MEKNSKKYVYYVSRVSFPPPPPLSLLPVRFILFSSISLNHFFFYTHAKLVW